MVQTFCLLNTFPVLFMTTLYVSEAHILSGQLGTHTIIWFMDWSAYRWFVRQGDTGMHETIWIIIHLSCHGMQKNGNINFQKPTCLFLRQENFKWIILNEEFQGTSNF